MEVINICDYEKRRRLIRLRLMMTYGKPKGCPHEQTAIVPMTDTVMDKYFDLYIATLRMILDPYLTLAKAQKKKD